MIKFDTINGTLCRMVEPTPLTPEATFPCVGRLIQDDSPMGLCNRWKYSEKQDFLKKDWTISSLENNLNKVKDIHYSQFEIIGYPVADGSAEWALYHMMQGDIVIGAYWGDDVIVTSTSSGWHEVIGVALYVKRHGIPITDNDFLFHAEKMGWQIYEPKPTYKVGDWVEYSDGTLQQAIIEAYSGQPGEQMVYVWHPQTAHSAKTPLQSITRKLSPSEVVVHIGCLSGTVDFVKNDKICPYSTINNICHFVLQNPTSGYWSVICFKELDAPTRNLVESLLKVQEEE